MIKKINSRIIGFSLVSALLLSLFIYPFGNASAAQVSNSQNSSTSTVEFINPMAANSSEYVTITKRFTSFPPSKWPHRVKINGFWYSGDLYRFQYVYDPDAGIYIAIYKGEIYAE